MNDLGADTSEGNERGDSNSEVPFHKQLRKATREIHMISDSLVNAKLAFALSDNAVWAEGLLIFYEIFRFLEGAIIRLKHTHLGDFYIEGMQRTEAFEKDLEFYLGYDWNKDYIPRESVTKYLMHLQKLEESEPLRLVAYVYHLYMGLLSGGQILKRRRELTNRLSIFSTGDNTVAGGNAVTDFGDKQIFQLKKLVVNAINKIAQKLEEDGRQALIEESRTVFELNNTIIRSINGANQVVLKKIIVYLAALIFVSFSVYYLFF